MRTKERLRRKAVFSEKERDCRFGAEFPVTPLLAYDTWSLVFDTCQDIPAGLLVVIFTAVDRGRPKDTREKEKTLTLSVCLLTSGGLIRIGQV